MADTGTKNAPASRLTPIEALARAGLKSLPWELWQTVTHRNGRPLYEYQIDFLSTRAVRELAYLTTEGWDVHARAYRGHVEVRVYRTHE